MSIMNVDTIKDAAGTGAPDFPNGVTVTGTVTATTLAATTLTGDGSALTGIVIPPTFDPVAVTGTTPSLDVGSYNYFDNGTLTADTTVSFASVPTNAQWQYTFTPANIATPYDLANLTTGITREFNPESEDTYNRGIHFKPDGTEMYLGGDTGNDINQYTLSTAWDISTATFTGLINVGAQDAGVEDHHLSSDGIYMYMLGQDGNDVNQYTLSTAWDITSATYTRLFSVASQSATPNGLTFKADGTKMYMIGQVTGNAYEYDLSTAWNLSTASFLQSTSVTGSGESITFSDDGLKMVTGNGSQELKEFTLSTAWDITSATLTSTTSIGTLVAAGLFFKPDGLSLFICNGDGGDIVKEYVFEILTTVTLPAAVVETPSTLTSASKTTYNFTTLDGGTTVNLIDATPQSTSYAAVGSYILGRRVFSAAAQDPFSAGASYAGSVLYPAGFSTQGGATDGEYASASGIFAGSTTSDALSGTWRAMGTTNGLTGKRENPVTVFVRIV